MPTSLDQRAALFRSLSSDLWLLLVLDNASTSDQVRPLLPGGRGTLTVVTSRRRLDGLAASLITLAPLADDDSRRLLREIAAGPLDDDAADVIVARCAGLPLALRLAAARLQSDGDAGSGSPGSSTTPAPAFPR
jgi:hypothetical protein